MPLLNIQQKDVKAMAVNPLAKDLRTLYPFLDKHFKGVPDDVIRFLALVYDPQSPMIRQMSDATARVKMVREHYDLQEAVPINVILLWCTTVVRSATWRLIVTEEALYEEFTDNVVTPMESKLDEDKKIKAVEIKSKLMAQLHTMRERLDVLYAELFADDGEARKAAQDAMLDYTPESISSLRENARSRTRRTEVEESVLS